MFIDLYIIVFEMKVISTVVFYLVNEPRINMSRLQTKIIYNNNNIIYINSIH